MQTHFSYQDDNELIKLIFILTLISYLKKSPKVLQSIKIFVSLQHIFYKYKHNISLLPR